VGIQISYVGYIPLVKQYIFQHLPVEHPVGLLEVGVDRGTTLIPLVAFLARTRPVFGVVGVDIKVQEQVHLMVSNLDLQEGQRAVLMQGNSLEVLPKMTEQGFKFDVILLDGDHNYHTVSKELEHLEALTHPHSLVVIDDYDGRWSDKDLWYAERDGYEDVKSATPRVEGTKHGVKLAVDEWLEAHPGWEKSKPITGEPILLMRKAI
jgi:predicted O-methyltransferase YrrM